MRALAAGVLLCQLESSRAASPPAAGDPSEASEAALPLPPWLDGHGCSYGGISMRAVYCGAAPLRELAGAGALAILG